MTGRFVCDFTVQLILILLILSQVVLFIMLACGFNEIHCFQLSASTNFCDFTLIRRNSRNYYSRKIYHLKVYEFIFEDVDIYSCYI